MPGMISGGGDEGGTETKPLLSGRSQVRLSATREKHGAEQDAGVLWYFLWTGQSNFLGERTREPKPEGRE